MARTFGSQNTDRVVWSGGPVLYNVTTASIVCWFKHGAAPISGNFVGIVGQAAAFNIDAHVAMKTTNDAENGKINVWWRTPTALVDLASTTVWDDGLWHRLLVVRRNSSPFVQVYVDGVSDGSSTTNPTTDATAVVTQAWGNLDADFDAVFDSGWGGDLARGAIFSGIELTPAQADAFLYTGSYPAGRMSQWLEFGMDMTSATGTEPDRSKSGLTGTTTGAAVSSQPPGLTIGLPPRTLRPRPFTPGQRFAQLRSSRRPAVALEAVAVPAARVPYQPQYQTAPVMAQ